MPIFFLLSGYFFKEEAVYNAAKKMFRSLIIPYFVVGIIMRLCQMTINVVEGNPFDYIDILSLFGVTWKFGKDVDLVSVGAIWFLVVLFWSKLYLQVVLKSRHSLLFLLLLANSSILITLVFGIVLPFGIQQAFVCALFVYAGSLCRKYGLFDKEIPLIPFMLFFLSVVPFMRFYGVGTRTNGYGYGMMCIIMSSFLSILVTYAIKKLYDNRLGPFRYILSWCGRFSIVILAVHSVESRYICIFLPFHNWFIEILIRILYIMILTCALVRFSFVRKIFNIKEV